MNWTVSADQISELSELSQAISRELSEEQERRTEAKKRLLTVLHDAPGRDLRREMLSFGYDPRETSAALRDLEHEGRVELNNYQYQLVAH